MGGGEQGGTGDKQHVRLCVCVCRQGPLTLSRRHMEFGRTHARASIESERPTDNEEISNMARDDDSSDPMARSLKKRHPVVP